MASRGSSIYKGSDLIHDYSCFKCEEDDFNTEAQNFCPQCEHYLCDKCVNMHNVYHKKHTVYGRGDIQKWAGFSIDRCDHHGNKLEVHCDDHQELCCSACVALNHRLCSSISHLPDLAKGCLETAEFKQLPVAVDKMRRTLDELKNARLKDQTSLKDSHKNIIDDIKGLRTVLNKILDQLEKNTVEQLDRLMNDLKKSVKDDVDTCSDMHDRLNTLIDKLQQVTDKDKVTNSYIGFRKCQTKLNEATILLQEIQGRQKERIRFISDEGVLPFLRNLNSIGYIDSSHVYKAQSSSHYSVKITEDKYNCHIVGICELPSGNFVVADRNNFRVKLLSRQFVVNAHCDLVRQPGQLCHTTGEEIAVIAGDGDLGEVQFITLSKGRLKVGRKFTIDQLCMSVAHHNGQLYVNSMNALYQYTMYGQLVKKIYEDNSALFTVYMCAVSPDGERIYVTNSAKHELVTLDRSGQVLSTLDDPDLIKPTGLCVSPSGYVFVCGKEFDIVLQVDREGRKKLATVARAADSLNCPQSVWFSEKNSSLFVANYCLDNITVVKLR